MAVDEKSFGPFYFAYIPAKRRWFKPHLTGIVMEHPPWRRGAAMLLPSPIRHGKIPLLRQKKVMFFPVFQWGAVALGFWRKRPNKTIDLDLEDEQWLGPGWMPEIDIDEIRSWYNGEEKECAPLSSDETT